MSKFKELIDDLQQKLDEQFADISDHTYSARYSGKFYSNIQIDPGDLFISL